LEQKLVGKTLWEWLTVLLVPLMIAAFTIAMTLQQNTISQRQHDSDQTIAADNRQKDIQIADDQRQATTLKAYLDDMTDLMLNHKLRQSKPDDEVAVVAGAKTLIALRGLDLDRKVTLISFLYAARLIGGERCCPSTFPALVGLGGAELNGIDLSKFWLDGIDLSGTHLGKAHLKGTGLQVAYLSWADLQKADLREANLHAADLHGANLHGANLQKADLSGAGLSGADLTDADLTDAYVTPEQLAQAHSLDNAILPDGSTYPSRSYLIPSQGPPCIYRCR
jgi:uncharacterized protein YjbI with pentapeptide repeats